MQQNVQLEYCIYTALYCTVLYSLSRAGVAFTFPYNIMHVQYVYLLRTVQQHSIAQISVLVLHVQ